MSPNVENRRGLRLAPGATRRISHSHALLPQPRMHRPGIHTERPSDLCQRLTRAYMRTWDQIEMTVMGITQFICQEVSLDLFDSVPAALRNDPWDYLKREIQTEW